MSITFAEGGRKTSARKKDELFLKLNRIVEQLLRSSSPNRCLHVFPSSNEIQRKKCFLGRSERFLFCIQFMIQID